MILAAEFPKELSQDMLEIFTAPGLEEAVPVLLSREQGSVFKPRVIGMVFHCNDCFDSDTSTENRQDCLSRAVGAPSTGIKAVWGIQLSHRRMGEKGEKGYKSNMEFVQDARRHRSERRY